MRVGTMLAAALVALVTLPDVAEAEPTVWGRAADPKLELRRVTEERVEKLMGDYERTRDVNHFDPSGLGTSVSQNYLKQMRRVLLEALEKIPDDPVLRLQLGMVAFTSAPGLPPLDNNLAIEVYEGLLRTGALAPAYSTIAWDDLAIAYARAGRYREEIDAYDELLRVQSHPFSRANALANQAEVYMVMGDIESATAGYRASLATLPHLYAAMGAATKYWGLAVSLDRAGDLEAAIENVSLARSYDAGDKGLTDDNWFWVPDYDAHWYRALGHLQAARKGELLSSRVLSYMKAAEEWKLFIETANSEDPYLELAKSRLKLVTAEGEAFKKRHQKDFDYRSRAAAADDEPAHMIRLEANPGP